MKRREFLITGVCSIGALVVARSLFAAPEPPVYQPAATAARGYTLHGSSRSGCAHLPGEEHAWDSLLLQAINQ